MIRHIIFTTPHAGIYNWITGNKYKEVHLQYGKHSPDKRIIEGEYIRVMNTILEHSENNYNFELHILKAGVTDSGSAKRADAVNILCDYIGGSKSEFLAIEPHINASGDDWSDAHGHKIWHNNVLDAKKYAKQMDKVFENHKPTPDSKRGIGNMNNKREYKSSNGFMKNVKCAALLPEMFFMTNKNEVDIAVRNMGKFANCFDYFMEEL